MRKWNATISPYSILLAVHSPKAEAVQEAIALKQKVSQLIPGCLKMPTA
jgi:hypothetical protein